MEIRKFRPDIEVLRAVAVVSVVIAHSGLPLKGGFVGVDIFFVISGFLITQLLFNELKKNNTISLKSFYARRILRIFPMSILVLLLTLLASFFWLSPLQFLNYLYDALFASISGLNYRLAATGTSYFNSTNLPTPFQHFWSLCVEEQFYIIWPAVILAISRFVTDRKVFKTTINSVLILIIGVSLFLSYKITGESQSWAYFGLHTRAWQLAIGALVAVNIGLFANIKNVWATIGSWLGFGLLILSLTLINDLTPYPSLWAILPTIGTAILIISGVNYTNFSFESVFSNSVTRWIGGISYSWYLVHWPIFIIFFYNFGDSIQKIDRILLIIGSLFVAFWCNIFIENPIRFNHSLKNNITKTYKLGATLVLIPVVICSSIIFTKNHNTEIKKIESAKAQSQIIQKIQESLILSKLPENVTPTLELAGNDFAFRSCFLEPPDQFVENNPNCIFGDKNSNKIMVLTGDSHAHQWLGAFDEIATKHNYKLLNFTKSSCSMEDGVGGYQGCYDYRKIMQDKIAELKPDMVITTGLNYKDSVESKYYEFLSKLKSKSKNVIRLVDTPLPTTFIPDCLSKNKDKIGGCNFAKEQGIRNPEIIKMENKVAADLGVQTVDPIDLLCGELCPAVVNNIIVYMDQSHITNAYAKYISGIVEERIFDAK
jgi:peptidoglycan/LPS O-acetylase OafA/YrhL